MRFQSTLNSALLCFGFLLGRIFFSCSLDSDPVFIQHVYILDLHNSNAKIYPFSSHPTSYDP
jgi:hypothetical protein